MYSSRLIESASGAQKFQLQCKGLNGLGPEWVPLQQDWSNRWCTLTERFTEEFVKRIHDFKTRSSDVFVVTFIKSGTTWMQELAWLLLNQIDLNGARNSDLLQRSPFLEESGLHPVALDSIATCDKIQSNPRLIKSHLPAQLLPQEIWTQDRKVIYVARNPRDVVVSTFHYFTGLKISNCSLDDFVDYFIADKVVFTTYWTHVIDFYRMRNEENVFFVTYEEMKRDLENVVRRLSRFLGCQQLSDSEMEKLVNHLSFKNMKGSNFVNYTALQEYTNLNDNFQFMRRGIVGSYKDELSSDSQNKINKWTESFLQEYGIAESDIFGHL
ncbi:sulfotransferase 1E1-like [Drosophila gunungcola]|uniref:Sulfotransferase domain-containing protein n=1 Tax=Drosophila gunungcola TaxID=103775 RepID=A0A9Q0BM29_9MUSC|nr:sulfotransferase 1E1-like [Drosophila gunungcola]KAI8036605.1 hypothetical protein M5D96_010406 [Drosophila gunungcola]